MKKIVCEMCESSNFSKEGGMFVCQECGMKYSVEEAQKLMIEVEGGETAVSATTNNTSADDELEKLYTLARRARDDNNSENAAKYYEMILLKDPLSWEASFYSVYFKAISCKIAQIESAGYSVANNVESTIALIADNVSETKERIVAISELVVRSSSIANMLYNGAKNHYDGIDSGIRSNYTQELIDRCFSAMNIGYNLGDSIENYFEDDEELMGLAAIAWENAINLHENIVWRLADVAGNKNKINLYAEKAMKYDEDFKKERALKQHQEKIAETRNRISSIENEIKGIDVVGAKKGNCIGWFFVIIGVIMLIMGMIGISLDGGLSWILIVGIAELAFGFIINNASKLSPQKIEENKKRVAKLTKDKEELEEKLKELEK